MIHALVLGYEVKITFLGFADYGRAKLSYEVTAQSGAVTSGDHINSDGMSPYHWPNGIFELLRSALPASADLFAGFACEELSLSERTNGAGVYDWVCDNGRGRRIELTVNNFYSEEVTL